MVSPKLGLSQRPSNISTGDNTTLTCRISSVTRHTTLMWTVDNVTYNTSGTFNTSRGQIVLSYSAFDSVDSCSKSSNLTILNVSMDSEGIYQCTAMNSNSASTSNVSITLPAMSSIIRNSSNSGELKKVLFIVKYISCFRISSCDRGSNNRDCKLSVYFDCIISDCISLLSTF